MNFSLVSIMFMLLRLVLGLSDLHSQHFQVSAYDIQRAGMNTFNSKKSKIFIMSSNKESKDTKPTRRSWEIGRFIKTANFYDGLKPKFIRQIFNPKKESVVVPPNSIIWSNTNSNDISWGPLDDVVMGGVSQSKIKPGDTFTGKWDGLVTSENNGGFVGIRTKLFNPPKDISQCRGIVLRIKGDGNRYKFIARDDDEWNGIAWSYSFDTIASKFMDIKIPISKLIPTKFARTVQNLQPFNAKSLNALQLSLSKFEYDGKLNPKFTEGYFQLQIESISTW